MAGDIIYMVMLGNQSVKVQVLSPVRNYLLTKQKTKMKKLFQYTILYHEYETTDKGKVYKDSIILNEPKFVLASSEKEVVFKATRQVDEKYAADSDNVQILIRNF